MRDKHAVRLHENEFHDVELSINSTGSSTGNKYIYKFKCIYMPDIMSINISNHKIRKRWAQVSYEE